tara:strand:+ start:14264 stop:14662 length:399 start_codon:yes stop_codon:yes gene_type:complete
MRRTSHIVQKPWGHEELWAQANRYVGKILFIKKGHRLSRQYHIVKEETIMVLDGTLVLEAGPYDKGGEVVRHTLEPGEAFHVAPGTIHRFCAEKTDVRIVEVSTPEVQDVVRLEDDYRRITDIPSPGPQSQK